MYSSNEVNKKSVQCFGINNKNGEVQKLTETLPEQTVSSANNKSDVTLQPPVEQLSNLLKEYCLTVFGISDVPPLFDNVMKHNTHEPFPPIQQLTVQDIRKSPSGEMPRRFLYVILEDGRLIISNGYSPLIPILADEQNTYVAYGTAQDKTINGIKYKQVCLPNNDLVYFDAVGNEPLYLKVRLNHSDLARGAPVILAGDFYVMNGTIIKSHPSGKVGIDNWTGHYQCRGEHLKQIAEHVFINFGFKEDEVFFKDRAADELRGKFNKSPSIVINNLQLPYANDELLRVHKQLVNEDIRKSAHPREKIYSFLEWNKLDPSIYETIEAGGFRIYIENRYIKSILATSFSLVEKNGWGVLKDFIALAQAKAKNVNIFALDTKMVLPGAIASFSHKNAEIRISADQNDVLGSLLHELAHASLKLASSFFIATGEYQEFDTRLRKAICHDFNEYRKKRPLYVGEHRDIQRHIAKIIFTTAQRYQKKSVRAERICYAIMALLSYEAKALEIAPNYLNVLHEYIQWQAINTVLPIPIKQVILAAQNYQGVLLGYVQRSASNTLTINEKIAIKTYEKVVQGAGFNINIENDEVGQIIESTLEAATRNNWYSAIVKDVILAAQTNPGNIFAQQTIYAESYTLFSQYLPYKIHLFADSPQQFLNDFIHEMAYATLELAKPSPSSYSSKAIEYNDRLKNAFIEDWAIFAIKDWEEAYIPEEVTFARLFFMSYQIDDEAVWSARICHTVQAMGYSEQVVNRIAPNYGKVLKEYVQWDTINMRMRAEQLSLNFSTQHPRVSKEFMPGGCSHTKNQPLTGLPTPGIKAIDSSPNPLQSKAVYPSLGPKKVAAIYPDEIILARKKLKGRANWLNTPVIDGSATKHIPLMKPLLLGGVRLIEGGFLLNHYADLVQHHVGAPKWTLSNMFIAGMFVVGEFRALSALAALASPAPMVLSIGLVASETEDLRQVYLREVNERKCAHLSDYEKEKNLYLYGHPLGANAPRDYLLEAYPTQFVFAPIGKLYNWSIDTIFEMVGVVATTNLLDAYSKQLSATKNECFATISPQEKDRNIIIYGNPWGAQGSQVMPNPVLLRGYPVQFILSSAIKCANENTSAFFGLFGLIAEQLKNKLAVPELATRETLFALHMLNSALSQLKTFTSVTNHGDILSKTLTPRFSLNTAETQINPVNFGDNRLMRNVTNGADPLLSLPANSNLSGSFVPLNLDAPINLNQLGNNYIHFVNSNLATSNSSKTNTSHAPSTQSPTGHRPTLHHNALTPTVRYEHNHITYDKTELKDYGSGTGAVLASSFKIPFQYWPATLVVVAVFAGVEALINQKQNKKIKKQNLRIERQCEHIEKECSNTYQLYEEVITHSTQYDNASPEDKPAKLEQLKNALCKATLDLEKKQNNYSSLVNDKHKKMSYPGGNHPEHNSKPTKETRRALKDSIEYLNNLQNH